MSSQSSHHPQEVLLAQFSLYVHKGGLKPDSFHLVWNQGVLVLENKYMWWFLVWVTNLCEECFVYVNKKSNMSRSTLTVFCCPQRIQYAIIFMDKEGDILSVL